MNWENFGKLCIKMIEKKTIMREIVIRNLMKTLYRLSTSKYPYRVFSIVHTLTRHFSSFENDTLSGHTYPSVKQECPPPLPTHPSPRGEGLM